MEQRKLKEIEFADKHRDTESGNDLWSMRFYNENAPYQKYMNRWVEEHCSGKTVLDYACGNGGMTRKVAQAGAELSIGMDISSVSIANAKKYAKDKDIDNIKFIVGDCEKTGLDNESMDIIICSGMLHHIDLSYGFYEMRRILKPGGVVFCFEALDYNPVIKLYRALTPHLRTEYEVKHILSYKDIRFARRFFEVNNIKHWHLFGILESFIPFSLWYMIDDVILKIPIIKMMSWVFTFEMRHKGR